MRKQLKSRESRGGADSSVKLQHAESKLSELRTTLAALGREATAAMEAVEAQQQQVTYERLLAMVWYGSLLIHFSETKISCTWPLKPLYSFHLNNVTLTSC